MHVLKTWYVSIKTEFLKQFFVFFSKPEKLSYEVLNGHQRYVCVCVNIYSCMYVSVIVCVGVWIYIHVCMCQWLFVCVCVCVDIYMYALWVSVVYVYGHVHMPFSFLKICANKPRKVTVLYYIFFLSSVCIFLTKNWFKGKTWQMCLSIKMKQ